MAGLRSRKIIDDGRIELGMTVDYPYYSINLNKEDWEDYDEDKTNEILNAILLELKDEDPFGSLDDRIWFNKDLNMLVDEGDLSFIFFSYTNGLRYLPPELVEDKLEKILVLAAEGLKRKLNTYGRYLYPPQAPTNVSDYINLNEETFLYEMGRQNGDRVWCHTNGQKSVETSFKDGEGIRTEWYATRDFIDRYSDDEIKMFETLGVDKSKQIKKLDAYHINGKREGCWTWQYENASTKHKVHYKNGELDGLLTEWYDNDSHQKAAEVHYKNGKPNGVATMWYKNGKKKEEAEFKNGRVTKLNKDGSLNNKLKFKNDVLEVRYFPSATKRRSV